MSASAPLLCGCIYKRIPRCSTLGQKVVITWKNKPIFHSFIPANSSFAVPKQARPSGYLVAEVHPPLLGLAVELVAVLEALILGVLSAAPSVRRKYACGDQSVSQRAYRGLMRPLYRSHLQHRLATN